LGYLVNFCVLINSKRFCKKSFLNSTIFKNCRQPTALISKGELGKKRRALIIRSKPRKVGLVGAKMWSPSN
jgi:hypothetical protein